MKKQMSVLSIIAITLLVLIILPKPGQFSVTSFPVKRPVSVAPVPQLNLVEIDRTIARTDSVQLMLHDVGAKMKSIDSLMRRVGSLRDESESIFAAVRRRTDTGVPLTHHEADSLRALLAEGDAYLVRSDSLFEIADAQLAPIGKFLKSAKM